MNPDCRIYSVPYNGANPEWLLQEVERRKEHIDHVYCELPFKEMISHVRFTFDDKKSAGEMRRGRIQSPSGNPAKNHHRQGAG